MSRRALLGDVGLALLFAVVVVLEGPLLRISGDGRHDPVWFGVIAVVPLAFRRAAPGWSLAAGSGLVLVPSLLVGGFMPWFYGNEVTLYVLLYSFARRSGALPARLGWLFGPLAFTLQLRVDRDVADLLFDTLVLGLAWLAGRTMRRFDVQRDELERTLGELAAEQQAREESAVAAERTRIAAEMHDVVAHAVSLMVVQVGATRIRLERDGSPRAGLERIEETGREALTDLRRMLGVLREVRS